MTSSTATPLINVQRQKLVANLREAIVKTEGGVEELVDALVHVLKADAWREREVRGELVRFATFDEFVRTRSPRGLGTRVERIEALISHDTEALRLLRAARVGGQAKARTRSRLEQIAGQNAEYLEAIAEGRPVAETPPPAESVSFEEGNNIPASERPHRGTSKAYAAERLKKEAPALYEKVCSGVISAHAAMVEAGMIKKPDGFELIKRAWSKASQVERSEFVDWLRVKGEV